MKRRESPISRESTRPSRADRDTGQVGIGGCEQLGEMRVERRRVLEIDVVAGIRHHDQRRGRDVLLHQHTRLANFTQKAISHRRRPFS